MADIEKIRDVLRGKRDELMDKPNVIATGIGYKVTDGQQTDRLCIKCSVQTKIAGERLSRADLIPERISDVPTDVDPVGVFSAYQDPRQRFRPAPGGVSVGHFNITAGTLGCWVQKDGQLYILSNNHVLANSNSASAGDPVLQPGPADGGQTSEDRVATLSDYVLIGFEGDDEGGNGNGGGDGGDGGSPCPTANAVSELLNAMAAVTGSKTRLKPYRPDSTLHPRPRTTENLVDAAIALPDSPEDADLEILDIGTIAGIREGELGMPVKKSGRTTGFTTGQIQQIDVTARVNYGPNRTATFTNQLMAGSMSQGGDSGSAVLDNDNNIVGLLFAGSSTTTLINRIQDVFDGLGVSLP